MSATGPCPAAFGTTSVAVYLVEPNPSGLAEVRKEGRERMALKRLLIRAPTSGKRRVGRPGAERPRRVTGAGVRPRTGRTRSRCWRSRTPPASPTWCRSGMAG